MHYLFNVYNRLFQSAILLYMYHLLTFIKRQFFFFCTSKVVTNECLNFSYDLFIIKVYSNVLFIACRYLFTMVDFYKVYDYLFFVNFCIIKKSTYWNDDSSVIGSWLFFFFFLLKLYISVPSFIVFLFQMLYTVYNVLLICLRTCIFYLGTIKQ